MLERGFLDDHDLVREAIPRCRRPVSIAYLLPFAVESQLPLVSAKIDEAFLSPLRKVEPGTPKHLAIVEVVRRAYKRWAMEADHRDKESRRFKRASVRDPHGDRLG